MQSKAIVAREPTTTPTWGIEDITVHEPSDNEVLVKITASGICHTDLLISSFPTGSPFGIAYPKILGHEGAGIVQSVGKDVKSVSPGDKVLLSYYSCSDCAQCRAGKRSYCASFNLENYVGRKVPSMVTTDKNEGLWARFFGQSSFAQYTVAAEASVVNVTDLIQSNEELNLFAPLGCGFQTGMGAIMNVADAGADDVVMVMGMGAVGMAALMAAKIKEAKTIIAVDKFDTRLELAKSLGATHTLNTMVPEFDFQKAVRDISATGASVIIDTTGVGKVIEEGVAVLASCGRMVHIAPPPPDFRLSLDIMPIFMFGKTITGCIEGNCIPSEAIPQMIQWYREGRFPIDKLVSYYPALEFGNALAHMHDGSVLKPVLTWD
ncbi:chaperonin 10-like protein [Aspergillus venezuelensis]